MTGLEVKMDQRGERDSIRPVNPLPLKCPHCTFPDLDFVANPYLLAKGISAPTETAGAMFGNFFVRERVRRILELAVPTACTFHPTADVKSMKSAPWWLAVPAQKLEALVPKADPPFCSKCHEPKVWDRHQGEVWERMSHYDSGGVDVFKTVDWQCRGIAEDDFETRNYYRTGVGGEPLPISWSRLYPGTEPPTHPERWTRLVLERELYFSVRLEQLLQKAKVKGQLRRGIGFDDVKLTPEDGYWVEEKFRLLAEQGLADAPNTGTRKSSDAAQKWFKQFLKRNAAKGIKAIDFAAVETKRKLTLPQDYKDFISKVGSKPFKNVNDMEETVTRVLPPHKLDFKSHRRGEVDCLVGEDAEVDGVAFAEMDNGDCFVFDVSIKNSDYPVFWFRHEESRLEAFAPSFAECIKRFVQKS